MMFRKLWYFTLTKGVGKASVTLYITRTKTGLGTSHYLTSVDMFYWWEALYYWFLFNLKECWYKKAGLFKYKTIFGTIHLRKLEKYMID